ncbi:hypothetical protein FHW68_001721 [Pseudomonas sp. Tn43]|nr:hypothetical protein [Pseudomonas sp. Tn43]
MPDLIILDIKPDGLEVLSRFNVLIRTLEIGGCKQPCHQRVRLRLRPRLLRTSKKRPYYRALN